MDYVLTIASLMLCMMILTQSYNLVLGYTGMVHVGHAGFMAIGAYASVLTIASGYSFFIGLVSGILAACVAGLILGLPTVRFKEDYLVAATLGMGEIIRLVLLNERSITGGSTGIPRITPPELFGIIFDTKIERFFLIFAITILVMVLIRFIVKSPFGKVLEAIREDEIAAKSLGKNTTSRKVQILVIASLFAGLSGVLYAHVLQFINPDAFNIDLMIYTFLIVVFGGAGYFWGPIAGTAILYIVFELFRHIGLPPAVYGPLRWILFSSLLIVMIIFKPNGILGEKLERKRL